MTDDIVARLRKGADYEHDTVVMEEAADEIERLLAEIEWAVAAIDADDLIGAHERLEALLRRFSSADQEAQVQPANCMYTPCRGLVTGYCDCQPGEH
jgi:TnpA family transposase